MFSPVFTQFMLKFAMSVRCSWIRVTLEECSPKEKSQQWQPALDVLSRAALEAIRSDAVLFSTALSSCEKCHRWET